MHIYLFIIHIYWFSVRNVHINRYAHQICINVCIYKCIYIYMYVYTYWPLMSTCQQVITIQRVCETA